MLNCCTSKLYLRPEVLAFPGLKKVILADAGNVVMADNRQEGLAMLWGVSPGMDPVLDSEIEADGDLPQGIKELDRVGEEVTGLGEALDDLREALERLRGTIGGASQ